MAAEGAWLPGACGILLKFFFVKIKIRRSSVVSMGCQVQKVIISRGKIFPIWNSLTFYFFSLRRCSDVKKLISCSVVQVYNSLLVVMLTLTYYNCFSKFAVPKWKTMGSQSEILFHEILNVQKNLVGWTIVFLLALKFGQNSKKTTLYQGGRSCAGARVAPAEKFGLGRKF